MFKNIGRIILFFSLLLFLFNSTLSASDNITIKEKTENVTFDFTYENMEDLFKDQISVNTDGEMILNIEKDLELEELLAQCKERGLKFGLALGSGSARGLAHVGVIQVLEAYHIPIDVIAGTSIGSVVGSLYATGAPIKQLEEAALSIKKSSTFFLMDPTFPRSGLISGNRIEKMLNKLGLRDKTFADLAIPFATVATDIENGTKIILNQGSVIEAVRASISIPGIFTPVKYHDYYLVDGGLIDPVPVDLVKQMGADITIAVSLVKINPSYTAVLMVNKETGNLEEVTEEPGASTPEKTSRLKRRIEQLKIKLESPNIFEVISQSIDIMEARITDQSLEGSDVVIIPFGIKDVHLFDFDKAEMLIKGGMMATLINMPEIKKAIIRKLE